MSQTKLLELINQNKFSFVSLYTFTACILLKFTTQLIKNITFPIRCEKAAMQPHIPRGVPPPVVPAPADVPHLPAERAPRARAAHRRARAAQCGPTPCAQHAEHAAAPYEPQYATYELEYAAQFELAAESAAAAS